MRIPTILTGVVLAGAALMSCKQSSPPAQVEKGKSEEQSIESPRKGTETLQTEAESPQTETGTPQTEAESLQEQARTPQKEASKPVTPKGPTMADRVNSYAKVRLTFDLSKLSDDERKMIPLLIEAARQMDKIFWIQAYGDGEKLLSSISDPAMKQFAMINYGPWDRLGDNKPFVPGTEAKPLGANFYPADLTKGQFEQYLLEHGDQASALKSLYTMVRRSSDGGLKATAYHEYFKEPTQIAAKKLDEAAALARDPGLKKYLTLRANALRTGEYRESDVAWLDMKNNGLDVVIGPIETYEDRLFGYKAAHEAYVLVKDKQWSENLAKYAKYLPELQNNLPVEEHLKTDSPGTDSDLNAYDVIYYAGDCNAGAKTIAINLPNDEEVQLAKGTRRLQLKNAMRAKFDKILVPIAKELIADEQVKHITFDAFFENTMFHEVAHGLGIKETITGLGTVREALKDQASALEEGKADVLGLFMVEWLRREGILTGGDIRDNYVTFMAGIFRSVRFGAASAHGRANMLRFNFFKHMGAFSRDSTTGKYRVDFERIPTAIEALSSTILLFQGQGNYANVQNLMSQLGTVDAELQSDLDRLQSAGIPVDIVFEQGMSVLN